MIEIAFIDHYDSFSHNLIAWLSDGLAKCSKTSIKIRYIAYDDLDSIDYVCRTKNYPVILSPGPNSPSEVDSSFALANCLLGVVPMLGVCLGHQILGRVAGMKTKSANAPLHGVCKEIVTVANSGFLGKMGTIINAASYNSLVLDGLPKNKNWSVTSRCEKHEVQSLEFNQLGCAKAIGVQFHPESFLSHGLEGFRERFVRYIEVWYFQGLLLR